jgi:hypothetical protein
MIRRTGGLTISSFSVVFFLAMGCGPAFNAMSGEDAKRGGAIPIEPNKTIDDQVSTGLGDDTDWKSFELPGDTNVRIRIWWDEQGIDATVTLYDQRAQQLLQFEHDDDKRLDETAPMGLTAGRYFLRIESEGGTSVYTMEVLSDAAGKGTSGRKRPGF